MDIIFGRMVRPLPQSGAERVRVGRDMLDAFMRGVENYQPVLGELPLKEEGGVSEVSYNNLCLLMEKCGLPSRVERHENGNVLVYWDGNTPEAEKIYLATGFEVGYLGTGPSYFARFGEKAGFGECDELYMEISRMDRKTKVGLIWQRKKAEIQVHAVLKG